MYTTDRDNESLADLFDERNKAVVQLIKHVISAVKQSGRKVGICGQAPSDYEGFAEMLVDAGIDSISLNPDSVLKVRQRLAVHESKISAQQAAHSGLENLKETFMGIEKSIEKVVDKVVHPHAQ